MDGFETTLSLKRTKMRNKLSSVCCCWGEKALKFISPIVLTRRLVLAAICIVVTVVGSCGTTIASNFWLQSFPNSSSSGQFAVELFAAICYFVFFTSLLVPASRKYGWRVIHRAFFGASFRPAKFGRRVCLMFCIGLNDIGTSILTFYAIPHTPEMLQALLQTTIPFFSLFLSFLFVSGEWARTRVTRNLVGSFSLMIAGLIVASWRDISSTGKKSLYNANTGGWVLIYILSCAVYSGWCVAQRFYLDSCTSFAASCATVTHPLSPLPRPTLRREGGAEDTSESSSLVTETAASPQPDKIHILPSSSLPIAVDEDIPEEIHKLTMLVGDAFFTMLLSVALLPIDVIPWFGTSPTMELSWQRFTAGLNFIFHNTSHNIVYGACYIGSELSTYLSCAYLNEYSPTLSSFVVQLAGPVTALFVIVFPILQPSSSSGGGSGSGAGSSGGTSSSSSSEANKSTTLIEQVAGVLLVAAACWLYYRWEIETAGEQKSVTREAARCEGARAEEEEESDGLEKMNRNVIN